MSRAVAAATVARAQPRRRRRRPVLGTARDVLRRPAGAVSAVFLVGLVIAVVAAPLIAPFDPLAADFEHTLAGPSGAHLLGTDSLGRDVLSRILFGGRESFLEALETLAGALVVGVPGGLVAGYVGGLVDAAVLRVADVLLAIPAFVLLLLEVTVFPHDFSIASFTLGVMLSPGLVRIIRSAVLATRRELYVDAARVAGLTRSQIIRGEILPRVTGLIIVQASLIAAVSLLVTTGLGFLGFGVQPPAPSWGSLMSDARQVLDQQSWLLVPTGGVVALTILALSILGDVLRDVVTERWSPRPARSGARREQRLAPTGETLHLVRGEPLLSVRDLSIGFGRGGARVLVTRGVTFDVRPGEAVGLVGESGCGKTATARALLGLLPGSGAVAGGEVSFDGRTVTGAGSRELARLRGSGIGYVSQEPMAALDPSFSVGSLVAEVVRRHTPLSRRGARERARELLALVRLDDPDAVARRYPHELSGGMAQRVAIAIALAGGPRLLVADEPTTALDVTVQEEILDLLHQLRADTGMALLLVTHDWGVVADVCEWVVVMYAGQVVEQGPVVEIFHRPRHPYTAALLASNPHEAVAGEPLPGIPGVVPRPEDWPPGCHFQPRCLLATGECAARPIPLFRVGDERVSRCLHHERVGSREAAHV